MNPSPDEDGQPPKPEAAASDDCTLCPWRPFDKTHTHSVACLDSLPVKRRRSGTTPSRRRSGTTRRRRTFARLVESGDRPDRTRGRSIFSESDQHLFFSLCESTRDTLHRQRRVTEKCKTSRTLTRINARQTRPRTNAHSQSPML